MKYFNAPNIKEYPYLSEEVREYFTIPKNHFGMPVDFAVDNNCFFSIYEHKPWMYFRNGYEDSPNFEWIPIVISKEPYVPFKWSLKISHKDIETVFNFVRYNRNTLIRLTYAGDIMELGDISKLNESQITKLYEMAVLRPEDTGIDVKIWIDNGGTYPQHSKYRIKFKSEDSGDNPRTWPEIIIDDNTVVGNYKLNKNKMNSLMDFINKYKEVLKEAIDNNWDALKIKEYLANNK